MRLKKPPLDNHDPDNVVIKSESKANGVDSTSSAKYETQQMSKSEIVEDKEIDDKLWYLFGCVLDRTFLISYIIVMVASCFIIIRPWFAMNLDPFFKDDMYNS